MIFTKKRKIADITFVIFTICWIVSRLGLLPYRILYFSMYRALEACQMFPAYYIFNGLLCTLQVLHIFWTYFMIKIVFYAIKTNEVCNFLSNSIFYHYFLSQLKDLRSDDEESFEEEIDNKNNGINGDKRIKTAKVTHDNANDKTAKNSKL